MYEQICFFISTHFFIKGLIFIIGAFFSLVSIMLILFAIGATILWLTDGQQKEDVKFFGLFIGSAFIAALIGLPAITTSCGLQKYDGNVQLKNNWLITKNKKIYLNTPSKIKVIKTNKLSPGFYYTLIGTQVKIEAIPITQSLPVIDYYDSLYVLSNGKIIKTKKVIIKKIRVDSWAQNMSTKWKIKHYTFYRWEWPYGLSWKKKGKLIKYTPI